MMKVRSAVRTETGVLLARVSAVLALLETPGNRYCPRWYPRQRYPVKYPRVSRKLPAAGMAPVGLRDCWL